jgi:hypothetical protein
VSHADPLAVARSPGVRRLYNHWALARANLNAARFVARLK